MAEPRHDVELGDLEHDAFLPLQNGTETRSKSDSVFIRWLPEPTRGFVKTLSRIKLVLLILALFLVGLVFLGFINQEHVPSSTTPEALALFGELTKNFSGTAIPEYVLTYAPLVFLEKTDAFYPSDLAVHVANMHPTLNFTPVADAADPLTLENLNTLNDHGGAEIYLASNEDITKTPKFFHGNRPHSKTLQTKHAISCVVIVADKGNDVVDAFYMYFYTFNQGPSISGYELGDHVGDWEHNMIRFDHGLPQSIWYSQHEYGEAFSYTAVQKVGKRPIAFSAKGSHANYAVAGKHDLHDINDQIPPDMVFDRTSHGPMWDPTLSAYYYTFSTETKKFTAAKDDTPVAYLYFEGQWGDPEYPDGHPGQQSFQGYHKWTGGPRGPLDKYLDRDPVCLPTRSECIIKSSI